MHKAKRTGQSKATQKRPVVASDSPVDHRPAGRTGGLVDTLKRAITKSGLTHYAIAKSAECYTSQIDRWMSGERRDIGLETAGRIATALGLHLVAIKGSEK